jgi:hypothetical protein
MIVHLVLSVLTHMMQAMLGVLLGGHRDGVQLAQWHSARQNGQPSASSGGAALFLLLCRSLARTLGAWPMTRSPAWAGGLRLALQAALKGVVLAVATRRRPRLSLVPSAAACVAPRLRLVLVKRRASAARAAMVEPPNRRQYWLPAVLAAHDGSCRSTTSLGTQGGAAAARGAVAVRKLTCSRLTRAGFARSACACAWRLRCGMGDAFAALCASAVCVLSCAWG